MPALTVTCRQCGATGGTDDGSRPHLAVSCPCCPLDHDHGAAASACPRGHDSEPCPSATPGDPQAAGCGVTPEGEPCGGGHCGLGVTGCTVCRPVIIWPSALLTAHAGGA